MIKYPYRNEIEELQMTTKTSTQDKINNLTKLMNQAKLQGKIEEVKKYKKAIKTLEFWG